MAKAKKLPSGSWRVMLYDGKDENEKRIYKSFTAGTKKEAEYMAAQYSVTAKPKNAPQELSVGDAMDQYIKSKDAILSPTTIAGYQKIRRNNLKSIMSANIFDLSNNDIQEAINEESRKLSPKSVLNISGLLNAALKMHRPEFVPRITLPQKKRRMVELTDPGTIFQLVKGTEIELPVLLAMWLGLRMSEIRGLTKADVSNGYLTIRNVIVDVDGKPTVKTQTKTTSSTRKLAVPTYIQALIDAVQTEYLTDLKGYIIYERFTTLLEKNGLPHMTFHDLRHLNASVMVSLGVPDKYAMERGGWSTNTVLKNVYQHTFEENRRSVDAVIDEFFSNICNTKSNTNKQNSIL